MTAKQTQIVVIGAGYAGLMAARRLAWKTQRTEADITLVNGTAHFIERFNLHKYAATETIPQPLLSDNLRGTGVRFVQGWVKALRLTNRQIIVQTERDTQHIAYDYLIFGLGSTIDRDSIPGVREHAYVLTASGEKSAEMARQALPQLNKTHGRVLIGGGGATGIEAAAEFIDAFPDLDVHLVTRGTFGSFINQHVADYMQHSLRRRGVTIQDHTTIAEVRANAAITNTGEAIPFDLCLWAGGFRALPLAREAGLAVNDLGQILIDPTMRSISHPEIYAIGDAAMAVEEPGVPMRMSAFAALVTGIHAADCLSDRLHGKTPQPLSYTPYGQAISLGRKDAILFLTLPDDKAKAPYFTGRLGVAGRAFFVRFNRLLLRAERWPGLLFVFGKGRYAAAKRRAEQTLAQVR